MRCITITYAYDGPENDWRELVGGFVGALNADADIAGKFTYQVATGDDGVGRVHWGRWDSAETLKTMQSRDYFKAFAAGLRDLIGGPPETFGADVQMKTEGW